MANCEPVEPRLRPDSTHWGASCHDSIHAIDFVEVVDGGGRDETPVTDHPLTLLVVTRPATDLSDSMKVGIDYARAETELVEYQKHEYNRYLKQYK